MTIKVTFEFDDVDPAISFLRKVEAAVADGFPADPAAPAPKPNRGGRPRKTTKPEPTFPLDPAAPTPSDVSAASSVEPPVKVTTTNGAAGVPFGANDVRNALQEVAKAPNGGGVVGASKIIRQFKSEAGKACTRVSEIKPADYAAVIAACKKVPT